MATDSISIIVVNIFQTMCQDMADEAGSEDEGEAEHDEMLVEYAGEVVPSLGKAMPQAEFATQFAQLLPLFANKTVSIVNYCASCSVYIGRIELLCWQERSQLRIMSRSCRTGS